MKRFRRSRSKYRNIYSKYYSRKKRIILNSLRRISEVKYSSVTYTGTSDLRTGLVVYISPVISQGNSKKQRIGNRIKFKFMQLRAGLAFIQPSGSGLTAIFVRILVVRTKLPWNYGGNIFSDTFLFDSVGDSTHYNASVNNQNVQVFYDEVVAVSLIPAAASSGLPSATTVVMKRPILNNVSFPSDSATVTDDPNDKYYFVVLSNINTSSQVNLFCNLHNRTSFIDI